MIYACNPTRVVSVFAAQRVKATHASRCVCVYVCACVCTKKELIYTSLQKDEWVSDYTNDLNLIYTKPIYNSNTFQQYLYVFEIDRSSLKQIIKIC